MTLRSARRSCLNNPAMPPGASADHQHQQSAEHQQPIVVEEADRLGQQRQHDRGHGDAPGRTDPADDHHGEQHDRDDEIEGVGGDELGEIGVEPAGEPGQRGADPEGRELVARDVDGERGRGILVLADGAEREAHPARC